MEERTRFKLRVEVLMLKIKDRNHKGKQGAYSADDAARFSFLKRTALAGLRWRKLPAEEDKKGTVKDSAEP
jgi:transposase